MQFEIVSQYVANVLILCQRIFVSLLIEIATLATFTPLTIILPRHLLQMHQNLCRLLYRILALLL